MKKESIFKVKEDYFIGNFKKESNSKQADREFKSCANDSEHQSEASRTNSIDVKNELIKTDYSEKSI